jgi:hypothetical protein
MFIQLRAVGAWTILCLMPVVAGAQTFNPPRTADGKPNLNGIWQAMNSANWDLEDHAAQPGQVVALGAIAAVPPGMGVVEGGAIPYLPPRPRRNGRTMQTG